LKSWEDHGRSGTRPWIIVATTFFTLVVIYGVWYSYSVFLVALVRHFGWSRSLVAGAFSFFVLVHGALGPVVGWLARRCGPRRLFLVGALVMGGGLILTAETTEWWHLYLAFGGLTAVGISLAGWVPAVVLIHGWFPNRFATAMGIASAGIGAGILALIPMAQFVIDSWGWRWAFRMEGLLTVGWLLPATRWLMRDPPGLTASAADPASHAPAGSWTLATAARTWRFWGVAGVYFMGNFATQMLMVHQVAYLVDHGVPTMVAATVGGAVGLVSIGGKVGWGVLSDRAGRELACTLAFGCVAASIGALVLAGSYPASLIPFAYAVLIGLGYAVLSPVFPAVAGDLYAGPGFSTIYGTLYAVICLGLAGGAWSAGKIFDLTASYAGALWIGLWTVLLTPALLWIVAPRRPNPPPPSR
jgi:MFS family permease